MSSGTRAARAWSAETLGSGVDVLPPALPLPESDPPPQPVSTRAALVRATTATAGRGNGLIRRTGPPSGDRPPDPPTLVPPVVKTATSQPKVSPRARPPSRGR